MCSQMQAEFLFLNMCLPKRSLVHAIGCQIGLLGYRGCIVTPPVDVVGVY